jgi:hypothetical protein
VNFSEKKRETCQEAFLGGISYTNNMCLNPRPQPGSPALENVLAQGAGLTPTSYRGAFGPGDQWAHKWTAIYDLGYLQGVYVAPAVSDCAPASLVIVKAGSDVTISFVSVAGASYKLQSATALTGQPGDWSDVQSLSGDGGQVSATVAIGPDARFFRVVCD